MKFLANKYKPHKFGITEGTYVLAKYENMSDIASLKGHNETRTVICWLSTPGCVIGPVLPSFISYSLF